MVDTEREAFEAWIRDDAEEYDFDPESDGFRRMPNGRYYDQRWNNAWSVWQARASLASRPAEVDDDGLPALPGPCNESFYAGGARYFHKLGPGTPYYTAEQYRQGQRDAVAADRAREWFVVGGRRIGRTYIAALARDAERYRWIREAQWFKAGLAKTEAHATSFHYSGDLLDNMVDQGRGAGERTRGGSR